MNIENNQLLMNEVEMRRTFLFALEWLLGILNRYSSALEFSLIHIEFGSNHELGEAIGVQRAFKELALLSTSFTNNLRKTDIVTRDVTDIWVIVPYNSDSEKIKNKILSILELNEHHDLSMVDRKISFFSPPFVTSKDQIIPTSGLDFLKYLKENKQYLASQVLRISANYEYIVQKMSA